MLESDQDQEPHVISIVNHSLQPRTSTSIQSLSLQPVEFHWGRRQVHALIKKVEEFFEDFYDGTKKKKFIWEAVAERMQAEGFLVSGADCNKKWRNLKGTYVKVLQKQMRGDISYRFEYFDALHHILGKEIDPLGMREQVMNHCGSIASEDTDQDYLEITIDDGLIWADAAVHLLLDLILERKDTFSSSLSPDVEIIWEEVAQHMRTEGQDVHSDQCQRKWLNLQEGFRFHQMKAESTASVPLWPFYTRVRHVMNSVNAPTQVHGSKRVNGQESLTTIVRGGGKMTTGASSKRTVVGKDRIAPRDRSILCRVKQLENNMSISRRLDRLEARVEASHRQQDVYKQTNIVLSKILSELQGINSVLEQGESFESTSQLQQRVACQQQDGPGSPNQGIIIVEAYSEPS